MKLVVGMVVGLVLGFAVSSSADVGTFFTVNGLLSASTLGQRFYVMGVHDALSLLAGDEDAESVASDTVTCMRRFENSEALRLWAVRRLTQATTGLRPVDPDRNAATDVLVVFKSSPCGF